MVHDAKEIALTALRNSLPGVSVVARRQDGDGAPVGEVVQIIATGGAGRSNRVLYTGQITVRCYGATPGKAMALALRVDSALHALVTGNDFPVTRVTGNSPADSPDPDTATPRVVATYQITTRNTP